MNTLYRHFDQIAQTHRNPDDQKMIRAALTTGAEAMLTRIAALRSNNYDLDKSFSAAMAELYDDGSRAAMKPAFVEIAPPKKGESL